MHQRHVVAEAEDAAAHADGIDHLTLCLSGDGDDVRVQFYPETTQPPRLARRLQKIIVALAEHPDQLVCAAGACDGDSHQ